MPRMLFAKSGDAVWISHLDLMRLLQRAFRRAGILLKHSQGYSPHPMLSIVMPLSVGVSSQYELADFELEEQDGTAIADIAPRLDAVMPAGIHVLQTYPEGRKLKYLKWLSARLTLVYDRDLDPGAAEDVAALFARPSLRVEKHSKKGPVEIDIQPYHRDTRVIAQDARTLVIETTVSAQEPNLNPLLLLTAIETYLPRYRPDFSRCHRLCLYDCDGNQFT